MTQKRSWWQLLRALYYEGHTIRVVPYIGRSVDSLFWKSYPNPCYYEGKIFLKMTTLLQGNRITSGDEFFISKLLTKAIIAKKWKKTLNRIIKQEKRIDFIIVFSLPLFHIQNELEKIKEEYNIPLFYFEGDMPIILPENFTSSRLKSNYLKHSDLSIFEGIFINSIGGKSRMRELGGRNIHTIHYGADPDLFLLPTPLKKRFDVFFYGHGNEYREEWIDSFMLRPASKLSNYKFLLGGNSSILNNSVTHIPNISFDSWRRYVSSTKVNLSITRKHHAEFYGASTTRIFELAAMKTCIISNPISGIHEWFEPNNEIIVCNDSKEIIGIYKWLLESPEDRKRLSENAFQRLLKDHTYKTRVVELLKIITSI